MRLTKISLAGLLVGLLLLPATAIAFNMIQPTTTGTVTAGNAVSCDAAGGFAHWGTDQIFWRINQANQGNNKVTALRNAIEAWNDVTGAGQVLSYGYSTTAGFSTDGVNSVSWNTDSGCTGGCLALTALTIDPGQVVVEADILMRNDITWTTNGAQYDTQSVLTHELGHALGIHHSEVTTAALPTMHAFYFGTGARTLHVDDADALRCAFDRYHGCSAAPATPLYVSAPGNQDLCQGSVDTYSTNHVPGATSYQWQVVGTAFSQTTANNEVVLNGHFFDPGFYTIRVRAGNGCGWSSWRNANLIVLSFNECFGGCQGRFCF